MKERKQNRRDPKGIAGPREVRSTTLITVGHASPIPHRVSSPSKGERPRVQKPKVTQAPGGAAFFGQDNSKEAKRKRAMENVRKYSRV